MNRTSRALLLALVGTGLSAAVAPAAVDSGRDASRAVATDPSSATTRPSAGEGEARVPRGGRAYALPFDPRFRYSMLEPTPEQIGEMEKFVGDHCPNRFKAYQNFNAPLGPNGNGHERLQRAMVHGYLELQMLLGENPDLYGLKVEQMELQDKIFGKVAEARERAREGDYARVRDELRPLEERLRENRRKQADLRVLQLSDALEREKQLRDSLAAGKSADVDKAVDDDIRFGGRIMWPPVWGGGPGPGGGGGRFGRPYGGGGGGGGGPTTEPSRRGR
jgi:hypothetical protein